MSNIISGPDGRPRCDWCAAAPEFLAYHDKEWGFPIDDDQRLFETICLESFQSGLSWRTILAKRENFRNAFDHFDFHKVALYTSADIEKLLKNSGVVRHRGKIEAVINNAGKILELIEEYGSFAAYVWRHEPIEISNITAQTESQSAASQAMAKDLRKRGWKFVGPTTVYAFMQAMGLFNDHAEQCATRKSVENARKHFKRPA